MFNRGRFRASGIDPDEIFLDAHNLPQFDTQQFEGVIEKPISKRTIILLGLFFILIGCAYMWRVSYLQVTQGETFATRSENNRLRQTLIFADRGVVYDRNGKELIWNEPGDTPELIQSRAYIGESGFGHLLGYAKPPLADSSGVYYQKDYIGVAGLESVYDHLLGGSNGIKIVETDALQKTVSESVVEPPHDGDNITLGIDADVEHKMYELIKSVALDRGFESGAGVIMDVHTGELLALTSYPEYSSQVLASGEDAKTIAGYNKNKAKPFLDRAVSGLYTPGSIVKPFVAIAALNEGVITPEKKILSTGSISIPNPYFPDKFSVFNDWKAHGWVDVKEALAVSSDVYFYEVGGGFEDQPGLGVDKIKEYMKLFGIGKPTELGIANEPAGTIPDEKWKAANFNGEPWRVGDTYHTAIGQYGFQVTPVQMVRATAAIANGGTLIEPHLIVGDKQQTETINIPQKWFDVVKSGMRLAVLEGTAKGLNTPSVTVGAKTGTAEVGISKSYVNSWIIGFFPYDKPRYAFAVVMEKGPHDNTIGGLFVMRQLLDWMHIYKPELLTEAAPSS